MKGVMKETGNRPVVEAAGQAGMRAARTADNMQSFKVSRLTVVLFGPSGGVGRGGRGNACSIPAWEACG
jgi:hypothetical protein